MACRACLGAAACLAGALLLPARRRPLAVARQACMLGSFDYFPIDDFSNR
jgi:hypothetical protein